MQNAEAINSDNRPLPHGWMQHYESSKQIWYYVQTNVMPPKVSFTHPADITHPNRRVSTLNPTMEMPRPNPSPVQPPTMPNPAQANTRISRAQQLYASSKATTAAPMISPNSIQNLSTSPVPPQNTMSPTYQDRSSTYTSNVPSMSAFPQVVNRPLPTTPSYPGNPNGTAIAPGPSGSQFTTYSTSSNFGNSPLPLSTGATPSLSPQYGVNHYGPHRTHSLEPPHSIPPNQSHFPHDPKRAQTYAPGQGGFNSKTSTAGPRPTPQLMTMARPPAELDLSSILQSNGPGNPIVSPPSMDLLSPLSVGGQSFSSSVTTPSPPASSILFSQPPNSFGSPISSPPTSPPVSISPTISLSGSNSSTITPENFNKPGNANGATSNGSGRLAAQAVFKIAAPIISATTGISSSLITGVGDLVTNPRVIKMMKSAFSKFNTGVAESDLQAVMQGRPNANYQAVLNALIRQQQLQQQQLAAQIQMNAANGMQYQAPPQQAIDYQVLITEIQRLQKVSQAQQAQVLIAQQQSATQQQALAHLQANALQQQQQQAQAQALAQLKHQQAIQEQQQAIAQQQAQQQQAAFAAQIQQQQAATQQLNNLLHQQQVAANGQNSQHSQPQHQQQGQNPYVQTFNHLSHMIQDMTQQQQQPQQQQQQPQQPSMTDLINSFGNGSTQQQQPQQPSMTDLINSAFGGNGSGQGQPPAFDPSALYTDPTGGGASANGGGGGGIFDTVTQTFTSNGGGDPSQPDTSGLTGFFNGFNQASTDPSSFSTGFDLGSLGAGLANTFDGDNSWSQ